VQRTVGDPALADATEIEAQAGRPANDRRTASTGHERPLEGARDAAGFVREVSGALIGQQPFGQPFGSQARVEERDVGQPLGGLGGDSPCPQDRGKRRADRDFGPRIGVQRR
jgi:hypothetical protein